MFRQFNAFVDQDLGSRLICHRVMLALVMLMIIVTAIAGCNESEGSAASVKEGPDLVARSRAGAAAVEVAPLDAPDNPYAGQYSELDEWIYEHALSARMAYKIGEYPDGLKTIQASVDQDGYMVPFLVKKRLWEEAKVDGSHLNMEEKYYAIYGEGFMADEGLLDREIEAAQRIKASFCPEIPDFVYNDPPFLTMLFPNGDVITHGALGSADDPNAETCCGGSSYPWYRYSKTGELIATSTVSWFDCYIEHSSLPDGRYSNRIDGYVTYTDEETGEILGVWDYDGTKLESGIPPPPRDLHPFTALQPRHVKMYYEYQNELRLTL